MYTYKYGFMIRFFVYLHVRDRLEKLYYLCYNGEKKISFPNKLPINSTAFKHLYIMSR